MLFATAKELFDPLPIGENVEILVMKLPAPEYMKRERAESGGTGTPFAIGTFKEAAGWIGQRTHA